MASTMSMPMILSFSSHDCAEQAVCQLQYEGMDIERISIVGQNWQMRQNVQGYSNGINSTNSTQGVFQKLLGKWMFIVPVAGALFVLGPLGTVLSNSLNGLASGAFISGLISLGVSKKDAINFEKLLASGSFLVVVHPPEQSYASN